jgi:hypothetical protein
MFEDFLRDLTRPEREAGDAAVVRVATVTAVDTSPDNAVQLTLTGAAWVRYLDGYTPAVDDDVLVLQQGPGLWVVLGKLA